MSMVPALPTARLVVRPFVLDDLDAVYHLLDIDLADARIGTDGAVERTARHRWLEWTVLNYEQLAYLHQPPYGDRAIGVILSGSGVDGADGIRAIKGKGGTTIAQDPATAAHAGMPQSARATGCVDFILPLGEIGPALVSLVTPAAVDP